jgi:hypothetical protein
MGAAVFRHEGRPSTSRLEIRLEAANDQVLVIGPLEFRFLK